MLAIKKARKLIEADPTAETSQTLAALVVALETEGCFPVNDMYRLSDKPFQLALDILAEWRLDRYYASKLRLLDASTQVHERGNQTKATPSTDAGTGTERTAAITDKKQDK